jgi:hypothetical protein
VEDPGEIKAGARIEVRGLRTGLQTQSSWLKVRSKTSKTLDPKRQNSKLDDLVKSLKRGFSVIPAKAGIQSFFGLVNRAVPLKDLDQEGLTVAEKICSLSPVAIRVCKEASTKLPSLPCMRAWPMRSWRKRSASLPKTGPRASRLSWISAPLNSRESKGTMPCFDRS